MHPARKPVMKMAEKIAAGLVARYGNLHARCAGGPLGRWLQDRDGLSRT